MIQHWFFTFERGTGTLELFSADLLKEGAFDEAVRRADYVFHTASPFFMKVTATFVNEDLKVWGMAPGVTWP
jgi:hypothetical protein